MKAILRQPVEEVIFVILHRVVVIDKGVVVRRCIALEPSVDRDNFCFLFRVPDGLGDGENRADHDLDS